MWLLTQQISIIILVFLQVYLPLAFNYIVLAERYILDFIADLLWYNKVVGLDKETISRTTSFLIRFIPRGCLHIFLYADYETLKWRQYRRGTSLEFDQFINYQIRVARSFSKLFTRHFYLIYNSHMSILETFQEIVRLVSLSEIQDKS